MAGIKYPVLCIKRDMEFVVCGFMAVGCVDTTG